MVVAPQQGIAPWHTANTAQELHDEHNKRAQGVDQASEFPRSQSDRASVNMLKHDPWRLPPHPTLKHPDAQRS